MVEVFAGEHAEVLLEGESEVIAKVLFNEKEVSLPGLTPRAGPYYDWPALRAHFLSLCE